MTSFLSYYCCELSRDEFAWLLKERRISTDDLGDLDLLLEFSSERTEYTGFGRNAS